ncbi:transposase [Paenibacillus sp. WQ 127069]|uniref:Transposase n=1 Tax=Paenibacillus baimaensis TaxID=2982185 RepID=A0ABT2USK5_9BACL|nr:transposase [Paenibacillus sp. WQ 127069]MCU6797658.1 transposase [Paenibacillus sp. WQ 127069]
MFAAINYETGHVIHREEEKFTVNVFQRFLDDILQSNPEGQIVIVLDNARTTSRR